MALLVGTLVFVGMAAAMAWLERGFLFSLAPWSRLERFLLLPPTVVLGLFVFAVAIAAAGPAGIPLAAALSLLAIEVVLGLYKYQASASRWWGGVGHRALQSNPDFEPQLKKSRLGRFIVNFITKKSR